MMRGGDDEGGGDDVTRDKHSSVEARLTLLKQRPASGEANVDITS